ncbi:glycerol-3-phosphate 1-O-acyltransferase PlsY [Roseibacterium sp. SDUM158017]|uniref:glycerol-3-phosphate 1-O-acyltransferase PlsY n=1 Tax=Roseicyclus salinarum TaxID=3036773 RepID=UPI0024159381|nr:glycerol-3-phosphate 1-O-acyltransferase PlsY [Roseibacterium sp. SDUM158017]MDG4649848.1 glycerol-3-phosphate 1-O-acyltransferase PlsY [Roseibacterium sp. SDUM158017]
MPAFDSGAATLSLVALLAYLLGSVPFGIVMARAFGLGDLRKIGSGNIGATNVLRTGNKTAAALTLILDAGKGGIAVLLARALVGGEDAAQIAAFAAFFGHCFPVYLRFRGGKGVATFFGTLFALWWPLGLAAGATWLVVAGVGRFSSLAALVAAVLSPVWARLLGHPELAVLCTLLAALIVWRHRENIARLRAGTEPRIGRKT